MLGGTSGEGVQWTVDDLDGGGGLMAKKKVLRLRAMAMCLWVPSFVGSLGGGVFNLVPELNYLKKFSARVPEFKILF